MAARTQFHKLLLTKVRLLTEDSVGLTFLVPENLADVYRFLPGQYLTLQGEVNGQQVRRPYSIASGTDQPSRLEVGIRRVDDGRFSSYANRLSAGIMMDVMTPQGQFTAEPVATAPGAHRNILVVAAGSGITPCLSIIKSLLVSDPASTFTLVFGNRSSEHVMFSDDIKALKDRFTNRLSVVYVMSRESTGSPLLQGHIDSKRLAGFVDTGLLSASGWHAAYCCGPAAMMDEVVPWLSNLGLPEDAVHRELFVTPERQHEIPQADLYGGSATPANTQAEAPADDGRVPLTIYMDGVERQISVRGKSETLLAAATRQGVDLPFSCAGGMCCTCRCKLLSGEVSMDANYSLASWEVENGYVLACQARALSESLEIDFDAT